MRAVESAFAVDSTGFGTQSLYRHYSARYGHDQNSRNYVKLHALIGTRTNVIAAATVTDRDRHDYPEFAPLVERGAKTFAIAEVSADKAYIGHRNLEAVAAIGAEAYIPFKRTMKDNPTAPLWTKLYHLYHYRTDEFLRAWRDGAGTFDGDASRDLSCRVIGAGARYVCSKLLARLVL